MQLSDLLQEHAHTRSEWISTDTDGKPPTMVVMTHIRDQNRSELTAMLDCLTDPPTRFAIEQDTTLTRLADAATVLKAATRAAVLTRRHRGVSWARIARDLGITPASARQRYVTPAEPHPVAATYPSRDAYYQDGRTEEGEARGWEPGYQGWGTQPFGVDAVRDNEHQTIHDPDTGTTWQLTICTVRRSPEDPAPHLDHGGLAEVVATDHPTGGIAVLNQPMAAGIVYRALHTIPRTATLQQAAGAIYTEAANDQLLTTLRDASDEPHSVRP